MSLPKRDGVHDRYYLIHKPDTSPEVLAEADLCIQDVLNGTARENHSAYPTVVRNHNGTPFLPDQLLERYLTGLPLKGFPCEDAAWIRFGSLDRIPHRACPPHSQTPYPTESGPDIS